MCFLVSEYFRWGKHGGYGTSTRLLTTELASRGFDITVLTPRRGVQPSCETVDGVRVIAYPAQNLRLLARYCREIAADVYHSQEPSLAAFVAQWSMPEAKHLVTCRDPRFMRDWLIEMSAWIRDGSYRTLLTFPYESNPCVTRAVRAADAVFCANHFSRKLAQKKYGLVLKPRFLPSPIRMPKTPLDKAAVPTVCYLGRWDSRKRPELFLKLAAEFPDVRFIGIGKARVGAYDRELRRRYGALKNLELVGFVDQFTSPRFFELLSSAWILVNTSLREGLPRSFMEAAACGCAILSRVDPDRFATDFGFRAANDNFAEGLRWLLAHERWRTLGQAAREYVMRTYELDSAVEAHIDAYTALMGSAASAL